MNSFFFSIQYQNEITTETTEKKVRTHNCCYCNSIYLCASVCLSLYGNRSFDSLPLPNIHRIIFKFNTFAITTKKKQKIQNNTKYRQTRVCALRQRMHNIDEMRHTANRQLSEFRLVREVCGALGCKCNPSSVNQRHMLTLIPTIIMYAHCERNTKRMHATHIVEPTGTLANARTHCRPRRGETIAPSTCSMRARELLSASAERVFVCEQGNTNGN